MDSRPLTTRQSASAAGSSGARVLRERIAAHSRLADNRAGRERPYASARFLGQVYDGGAMGSAPNLYYLTHPVQVTGAVVEGGAGTFTVDGSTSVPVLVLNGVPMVGTLLTAYSVGGRWVSELTPPTGGGAVTCAPCSLPATNLTISWVNGLSGNGSDTLTYTGGASPIWQTGCSGAGGDNIFKLVCTGGSIELRVYYFTSGFCPTGGSSYCSNLLTSPRALTLSAHTCSPLSLTFTCGAACSFLTAAGYTSFTITP